MLVIVDNLGSGAGAHHGGHVRQRAPYVVAGKGSFSAGGLVQDHGLPPGLHHAIQFAYGFA